MQLESKDGIACDLCGTSYKLDFVYYSVDIRAFNVHNNIKPSFKQLGISRIVFSLDVCQICYNDLAKKIVTNNKAIQSDKRRVFVGILDDLSGTVMQGDYIAYYCNFSKVDVKISGQISRCKKCQVETHNDNPCKNCGSVDFLIPAKINIAHKELEIFLSEESYQELIEKTKNVRKVAGEWSTNS